MIGIVDIKRKEPHAMQDDAPGVLFWIAATLIAVVAMAALMGPAFAETPLPRQNPSACTFSLTSAIEFAATPAAAPGNFVSGEIARSIVGAYNSGGGDIEADVVWVGLKTTGELSLVFFSGECAVDTATIPQKLIERFWKAVVEWGGEWV